MRQSYTYHVGATGKKKLIDICQLKSKAGYIYICFWRRGVGVAGIQLFKRMNVKIPTLAPTVKNCLVRHL